jgi:hypothetical protein
MKIKEIFATVGGCCLLGGLLVSVGFANSAIFGELEDSKIKWKTDCTFDEIYEKSDGSFTIKGRETVTVHGTSTLLDEYKSLPYVLAPSTTKFRLNNSNYMTLPEEAACNYERIGTSEKLKKQRKQVYNALNFFK